MGLCFSKKKRPPHPAVSDPTPHGKKVEKVKREREIAKKESKGESVSVTKKIIEPKIIEPAVTEKKPVFVITQNSKVSAVVATVDEREKKKSEVPTKKPQAKQESEINEEIRLVPVPTSSCTKEELDAILIQCGRLSRSSSGKAAGSADTGPAGGSHRRYSGSKRSYDFDHEKRGGEDEEDERPLSRPSPHRRTPGRERSGSRERGNNGSRRVSRSPGRRSDGPSASASASGSERSKQQQQLPAKMVSVPAREKAAVAAAGSGGPAETSGARRGNSSTMGGGSSKRSASPRSRSPAANSLARAGGNENAGNQSLSRNSSRKAEHSPYRRNPMSEIDENSLKGSQNGGGSCKSQKVNQAQIQRSDNVALTCKQSENTNSNKSNNLTNCIRDHFVTCRVKEHQHGEQEITEEPFDPLRSFKTNSSLESLNRAITPTSRSSRRSSRDFDHQSNLNPNSYASLLLEDIQNYHQNNNNNNNNSQNLTAFSLPACVSKACSILDAVADLNSSSSEGQRGLAQPFVESEVGVKDDLMEPSMHKYVSVSDLGAEMEPQESAGSNSFVGQPWASPWEPNSVDSTDRYWASSQSNNGDEVEQEGGGIVSPVGLHRPTEACNNRRLVRGGSGTSGVTGGSTTKKVNRNGNGSGRSGIRAVSITATASASNS